MVLGHGDASVSHGLRKGSGGAPRALGREEGVEETVAAWGKWLNVKSKKVEKAIFQTRFAPHFSLLLGPPARAVNLRPVARTPGVPSAAGPTRPRPQSAHLPVGPVSIRSLAEDVTALNIY